MDKRLLDVLCCPLTKTAVRVARREELEVLNRSIALGGVINVAGISVNAALGDALITRDGKIIYRIDDDIPVMLVDEAINTNQLNDFPR